MTYEQAIKILKNEQYASGSEKAEAVKMAVEAMETAKKHEDVLRVLEKWSMQRPMPIMPATMTLREQDEMLGIIPKESEQE